ncbi:uncharacterized protein M421DRAFT_1869 [Didymella exigua CBS 183.55]|uniref:Uncharacterized protein n=1 Tax=Didymella exigua CBS 183.55 TaxID=1150837 RepID=A0A6A5RUS5_9PLEO|nr:uncharacterized protein M421DRAFT_1869 [Didymella exigua CBS 183.55]KAF1932215.1 hypothetical protein M421DRAFT_1869 [Didymella exigua CBS 183.55]
MPPNAATNDSKAGKTYSADVVAAVLMATGTTPLSMKHYELMSSLDGVKTASEFQHDFRAVLARAKELKARVDNGEIFEPVAPATKRGGTTTPATPKKRNGDDVGDSPSKKSKATPKPRDKKARAEAPPTPQTADDDLELPEGMDAFIRAEKQWEVNNFVWSWRVDPVAHDTTSVISF